MTTQTKAFIRENIKQHEMKNEKRKKIHGFRIPKIWQICQVISSSMDLLFLKSDLCIFLQADVKNLECILTENVKKLSQNKPSKTDENEKKELIQRLEKLHKNMEISKSTFDKCQGSLKSLRTETLREKSVQISKIQAEETVDVDAIINSVMPIPSDPKLIDI